MKKVLIYLWMMLLLPMSIFAQDIKGETLVVLKGRITVIKFNTAIVNYSLGEKDDFNLSVEEGKTIYLSAKSSVANPKTTNLAVSEGKRTHLFVIKFQEKGDVNTYYDYSDLKKLKKLVSDQGNSVVNKLEEKSYEPIEEEKVEASATVKETKKSNKEKEKEEKKRKDDIEAKIAEEKRQQALLDERIAEEKRKQEEQQQEIANANKEKLNKERLAAEEKKRKQKEQELAKIAAQKQALEEQKERDAVEKESAEKIAQEKADLERLKAEEKKRKQKQAELDRIAREQSQAESKNELAIRVNKMAAEKQQQEELNAKLLAEKKQRDALEKQLTQEKANSQAKEAALEKIRMEKEAKEAKLAAERKKRDELQAKIDEEKKKKEEADRIAKEEREKFVLPPAQVDIRKKFPSINFNEPPEGQNYDGMYFGDTSAYYMASQKLLDQSENSQFKNAITEMDGIKISLCNIDFSGKAVYIRFKIENKSSEYFILGATLLRMLEAESGKKYQLNPYYISSFPIIASGDTKYVVYVMKPEQNISPDSFVMLSIRERQRGKRFELSFPGNFYTEALKKAQR